MQIADGLAAPESLVVHRIVIGGTSVFAEEGLCDGQKFTAQSTVR